MLSRKRKDLPLLGILSGCFLLGLFIMSAYTSPLYPDYHGNDSAIFSLVGKGLSQGKLLYGELFDHKGPIIFFINALGHLLGGRIGIFLLQCIAGLITLSFLHFTAKLLLPEETPVWKHLLIFVAGYSIFFFTFQRGNLTEEYSLPFISGSLYFFTRYALHADTAPAHPPKYALFYGIGFAFLAFLRLNNAISIAVGCFVIILYLIIKKQYGNLLQNLLFGLLGLAIVSTPILVYFYCCHTLQEMLYATFLYNFQIVGNTSTVSLLDDPVTLLILYLPMACCTLLLIIRLRALKKPAFLDILLGALLAAHWALLGVVNRYPHYFTVFIPVYMCFLFRYLRADLKKATVYAVALCTVVNLAVDAYYLWEPAKQCLLTKQSTAFQQEQQAVFSRIPESERSSVIGYRLPAWYYLAGDIIPCYKYYTLQDVWAQIDGQIYVDFMTWLSEDPPLWVVTLQGETNTDLQNILEKHYTIHHENRQLTFYRRK